MASEHDPDTWNTPTEVLDRVRRLGAIGLDPCSNATSIVGALRSFTWPTNGLYESWGGWGLVFTNPPYSRGNLIQWCAKVHAEAMLGTEIVALVPASTETEAWSDHLWHADAWCFPDHRIRFLIDGQVKGSGRKGHALVYFGPRANEFCDAFDGFGRVLRAP